MPRKLVRHLASEELEQMYKMERDARLKERLHAILYERKNIEAVAYIIRRARSTIENLRLEKGGYDGLKPNFTGGPKLPADKWSSKI
ncbi:MAG: hypothetical protein QXH66_07445 [Conexivisphaerales archaeon]